MEILYATTLEQALEARRQGYEPVECSFGSESVVGPLALDHHGRFAVLDAVSVRAAEIAQDSICRKTRFVVAGMADPDSVYTILALAGEIRPSIDIGKAIAELDIDPIGIDRAIGHYIRNALFDSRYRPEHSLESFKKALDVGKAVFDNRELTDEEKREGLDFEIRRKTEFPKLIQRIEDDVAYVVSDDPGRDIWHQRASVVVQYKPTLGVVTISGCTDRAAERLGNGTRSIFQIFGEDGLDRVYANLFDIVGKGSGGRKTIGGTPRGFNMSPQRAEAVYERVRSLVKERSTQTLQ